METIEEIVRDVIDALFEFDRVYPYYRMEHDHFDMDNNQENLKYKWGDTRRR